MNIWRAAAYRLFAGGGRPAMSVGRRIVLFVAAVILLGILAYRYTPPMAVGLSGGLLLATIYAATTVGVMVITGLTDVYQRSFLVKLCIFDTMAVSVTMLRRLHLLAAAPVAIAAITIVSAACVKAFAGNAAVGVLIGFSVASCFGSAFFDILLRIARLPVFVGTVIRLCAIVGIGCIFRQLVLGSGEVSNYIILAAICAFAELLCMFYLAQRPLRQYYEKIHIPLMEGQPGIIGEVPLRAMRTNRFFGVTAVLFGVVLLVGLFARARTSVIPLDGVMLIAMVLIGTLGQEARVVSGLRPVELTYYAALRRWLSGTWLSALIYGLVWIDLCLIAAQVWSPHGLSVGYMHVGLLGVVFVALGIAAASIIVPAKDDIMAQCASTALYGLFVWMALKLPTLSGLEHVPWVAWVAAMLGISLIVSFGCERRRWLKTIRSVYVPK